MNIMKKQHTPGPWTINWYECKMDNSDVEHAKSEGNLNAKVGDVLWRSPRSIGPCGSEHSHWGGDLLTVEEADARLIAAAPDLLEALKEYVAFDHVEVELNCLKRLALAAIAKATGEA
jgi:hypothetical protein